MTRTHRGAVRVLLLVLGVAGVSADRRPEAAPTPHPPPIMEEAHYRAAAQLYERKLYPQAADAYRQLLALSLTADRRKQASERLFDIALYWLQDTWEQMRQLDRSATWMEGVCEWMGLDGLTEFLPDARGLFRRWLPCRNFVHLHRSKPIFNEEGRALELLACVHDSDPAGPLADKALLLMGHVRRFREDYRRTDQCFSRLIESHPDSPFAAGAIQVAILVKLQINDDPEGEIHRLADIRKLIAKALQDDRHPTTRERERLLTCLCAVNEREARRALQVAEARQRAGQPALARQQYELVRRRYPNTSSAFEAAKRLTRPSRARSAAE